MGDALSNARDWFRKSNFKEGGGEFRKRDAGTGWGWTRRSDDDDATWARVLDKVRDTFLNEHYKRLVG